jgi:hypothetical protein
MINPDSRFPKGEHVRVRSNRQGSQLIQRERHNSLSSNFQPGPLVEDESRVSPFPRSTELVLSRNDDATAAKSERR